MRDNRDFYKTFEDTYRGSHQLIKNRLKVYLEFINKLKLIDENINCIDLGCGRGEWLELLNENSISTYGVDLDEGMFLSAKEKGLNVDLKDAISALKECENDSYWIVSGFHIVEHLPFHVLESLLIESNRVIKPGGLVIFETPNPENIKVATNNFFLDPTHIRPIPPIQLSFLAEFYGFNMVKILRLQESEVIRKSEQVNILNVLEGVSPDYSIIAQKNVDDNIKEIFKELYAKKFGLSQIDITKKFDKQLDNIHHLLNSTAHKANSTERSLESLQNEYNSFYNNFLILEGRFLSIENRYNQIKNIVKKILFPINFLINIKYFIKSFIKSNRRLEKFVRKLISKTPYLRKRFSKEIDEIKTDDISSIEDISSSAKEIYKKINEKV